MNKEHHMLSQHTVLFIMREDWAVHLKEPLGKAQDRCVMV